MKPSLNVTYLVAHELEGAEELRKALKESKTIPDSIRIEGVLIDNNENLNGWRVPTSQFPAIIVSLKGAPYLKDHNESVDSIAGQVAELWQEGNTIKFKADIDDPTLIPKILRGRVKYSSIQVESDYLICSRCFEDVEGGKLTAEELISKGEYYTRKEGAFTHLHKGAHEVVLNPRGKEISAVVFPAYKIAEMKQVVGFHAALTAALVKPSDDEMRLMELRLMNNQESGGANPNTVDASDRKKISEPTEVNKMVESEKKETNTLTADEIAKAVTYALEAHETARRKAEEETKKREDYDTFLKTWESASGKIKELEKNYEAAMGKLEATLKKFEEEAKKREDYSEAAKKLNEAKGKKDDHMDDEEVEAVQRKPGEEDTETKEGKKKEASEVADATLTGKAVAGEALDKNAIRTGLNSKMFPPWYREIIAKAKKHPRTEA